MASVPLAKPHRTSASHPPSQKAARHGISRSMGPSTLPASSTSGVELSLYSYRMRTPKKRAAPGGFAKFDAMNLIRSVNPGLADESAKAASALSFSNLSSQTG